MCPPPVQCRKINQRQSSQNVASSNGMNIHIDQWTRSQARSSRMPRAGSWQQMTLWILTYCCDVRQQRRTLSTQPHTTCSPWIYSGWQDARLSLKITTSISMTWVTRRSQDLAVLSFKDGGTYRTALWWILLVTCVNIKNKNIDTYLSTLLPPEILGDSKASLLETVYNAYKLKNQPKQIHYYHAATGFPTKIHVTQGHQEWLLC